MKLLGDRVLLKREKVKESTSAIIVPDKEENRWEVISVGPEVESVGKGDVVAIERYSGDDIEVENETLHIVTEEDIMGIYIPNKV
jgi:co-chaperonin GroES (HSP10)